MPQCNSRLLPNVLLLAFTYLPLALSLLLLLEIQLTQDFSKTRRLNSSSFPAQSCRLVVTGGGSRSRGCGFKSQYCILDGHFFTLYCCKNCIVCLKRPNVNEIEAENGPFLRRKRGNEKKRGNKAVDQ